MRTPSFNSLYPKLVKLTGLGIAIYETLIDHVDRPSLLILAAGMMGLESVIKAAKHSGSSGSGRK